MLTRPPWLQKGAFLFGIVLLAALCVTGLVYELVTEKRLPSPQVAHYVKARGFVQMGKYRYALAQYRLGTRIRPDLPEGFLGLANAQGESGNQEGQVQALQALLAVRPEHREAHVRLAAIFEELGEHRRAIDHYRLLVEAEPRHGEVRYNLGVLLLRSQRYDEAEEEFAKTLALMEDDPRVHNNLGVARIFQNKPGLAVEAFAAAVRLEPENRNYRANLEAVRAERNPVGPDRDGALASPKGPPRPGESRPGEESSTPTTRHAGEVR